MAIGVLIRQRTVWKIPNVSPRADSCWILKWSLSMLIDKSNHHWIQLFFDSLQSLIEVVPFFDLK